MRLWLLLEDHVDMIIFRYIFVTLEIQCYMLSALESFSTAIHTAFSPFSPLLSS